MNTSSRTCRFSGKKQALLIGVTYVGQENELQGPINDVKLLYNYLITKQGYDPDCIAICTDGDIDITGSCMLPANKDSILMAIRILVDSADSGDSLFFSFSGHGTKVVDVSGDEEDGFDGAIRPSDYKTAGDILDDHLYDIVKDLPVDSRLFALFDCCHSGTMLDLPYNYDVTKFEITMKPCNSTQPQLSTKKFVCSLLAPVYVEVRKEVKNPTDRTRKKKRHMMLGGLRGAANGLCSVALTSVPAVKQHMHRNPKNADTREEDATRKQIEAEVCCLGGSKDYLPSTTSINEETGLWNGQLTLAFLNSIDEAGSISYRKMLFGVEEKLESVQFMHPQFSTSVPFDVDIAFSL